MKAHIKVTQDHIDRGYPEDSEACPVAMAIQEQLVWSYISVMPGAEVEGQSEDNMNQITNYTGDLPDIAADFIRTFDEHGRHSVKPFEFDMEIEKL